MSDFLGNKLLSATINKFKLLLLYIVLYKGYIDLSNPKNTRVIPKILFIGLYGKENFMNYCDLNENILECWHLRNFGFLLDPTTNRVRRYFPDFFIKYKDKDSNIRRSVIEVKPMRETLQPKLQQRVNQEKQ